MEQQVSPLGKPMSTAIKRSAQVRERYFFLQHVQRIERALGYLDAFWGLRAHSLPMAKVGSWPQLVHGILWFPQEHDFSSYHPPSKHRWVLANRKMAQKLWLASLFLGNSRFWTLSWTAYCFMPSAKSTLCFAKGRCKFYRRDNDLLVGLGFFPT